MDVSIEFDDVMDVITQPCPNIGLDSPLNPIKNFHSRYSTCDKCVDGRVFRAEFAELVAKTLEAKLAG